MRGPSAWASHHTNCAGGPEGPPYGSGAGPEGPPYRSRAGPEGLPYRSGA